MKKIFVLFCIFMSAAICFHAFCGQVRAPKNPVKIYYIDRRLHKLVPVGYTPKSSNASGIAREITYRLFSLENKNPEILSLLPRPEKGISVKVKNSAAVVDIPSAISEEIPKNIETERLFVYQIVNSLTSADGIETVRFTIDGKSRRDLLGFLDMREIFTPDYDI